MIVAEQFEHLQQSLVWQAFAVVAVANEQLEQAIQRRVVLLASQLLHRQLIDRLIVLRIFCQAGLQLGGIRQVLGLAEKLDLCLGAGQCSLVFIALDRVEHGLRLAQLTAFGEAAGIEDQRLGVGVVFAQQHFEDGFGVGEAAVVEQRLGLVERICGGRWRHLHVRLEQRAHG